MPKTTSAQFWQREAGLIIEQAFHHLPEILAGTYYPRQDYEGGIVASFMMALLQELNGRNATNPLSLLQCECPYKKKPHSWPHASNAKQRRYLRADLNISLGPLRVGNRTLAGYGWRHINWCEAKYFRAISKSTGLPKSNSNQALHTALLLADVFRLLCLVPRHADKNGKTYAGRYLLHVYTGDISQHLSLARGRKNGIPRQWLNAITKSGSNTVVGVNLTNETPTIRKAVGKDLSAITLDFEATNYVITPRLGSDAMRFTCILTRFDSFKASLNGLQWGVNSDRSFDSAHGTEEGNHTEISEYVGARIGLEDNSDEINAPMPVEDDTLNTEMLTDGE